MIKNKKNLKICIVKLSAMGDIIHAMVALQFIKQHYPQSTIDWIVEEGFKGVLENNPDINNILPINLKSIKKNKLELFKQIKILRQYSKNNYDVIIDAQGLLKSAIAAKIVSGLEKKSIVIGFDKYSTREGISSFFYDEKISIPYEENVINRNIAILCNSLDINVSKEEIINKNKFLYSSKKEDQNYNIIFVVGASKENKIYPKENFLELSYLLEKEILVVWGNDEEYSIAKWLSQNNKKIHLAPKGSLNELIGIISNAKMVIGADTGPTHIAWALNIPSITIFGNTPEYRNTYITEINKVIKSDSYVNPLKLDKKDFSIQDIKAETISEIAKELLI